MKKFGFDPRTVYKHKIYHQFPDSKNFFHLKKLKLPHENQFPFEADPLRLLPWLSVEYRWEVEIVIVDNDKKAHNKTVTDAWEKFGINVWPDAGQVNDRTCIADFTGESADKLNGFSVNPVISSDCMVQDQSANNTWKNLVGGLYRHIQQARIFSENYEGFYNDISSSLKI